MTGSPSFSAPSAGLPGERRVPGRKDRGRATSGYLRGSRQKALLLGFLLAAMAAAAVWAVTQGNYALTVPEVLRFLFRLSDGSGDVVIWNIRMPRIAASIVTGWGLSVTGLALQSLLKNPLGAPSTIGISQGAAFGAALGIVALGARMVTVTAFAFVFAMMVAVVILMLARLKRLAPETIILAGVALSSLFASATVFLQYLATDTQLAMVVFWTFGDVARSGWKEIGILTLTTAAVTLLFGFWRWDLNALAAGEDEARGLGVHVDRLRVMGMLAATLVVALATAFHGVIAFLGLIAPHIARRLVGADHGFLMPVSAAIGALLLLLADTLGRLLTGSGSLPVGVITSFMGAPMFLYLLIRGYR